MGLSVTLHILVFKKGQPELLHSAYPVSHAIIIILSGGEIQA
jgi:hypothetical protein